MSQSYRVNFRVRQPVCEDDEASIKIDLQPILSKEDMKAILRGNVEGKGFERQEDGSYKKTVEVDGVEVEVTIDAECQDVKVKASATTMIDEDIEARGYDDVSGSIERSRAEQTAALLERKKKETQGKVSKAVEQVVTDVNSDVQDALEKTYGEALKQKARNMGEVVEQHEGTNERGDYELVIKVRQGQ